MKLILPCVQLLSQSSRFLDHAAYRSHERAPCLPKTCRTLFESNGKLQSEFGDFVAHCHDCIATPCCEFPQFIFRCSSKFVGGALPQSRECARCLSKMCRSLLESTGKLQSEFADFVAHCHDCIARACYQLPQFILSYSSESVGDPPSQSREYAPCSPKFKHGGKL